MNPRRPHTRRLKRRPKRQEGAVLFLVLMVVALSTLGATFAVQDSTYALQGARGAQDATRVRYAAETGVNSLPALVGKYGVQSLQVDLHQNANLATQVGDAGTVSFPHGRLHMPPPQGAAFKLVTSKDMEQQLYTDGGVPLESILDDPRSPQSLLYENVVESTQGLNEYHYTVSTYGRASMGWDEQNGTYLGADAGADFKQSGDENFYHDTVSVARGYYTASF